MTPRGQVAEQRLGNCAREAFEHDLSTGLMRSQLALRPDSSGAGASLDLAACPAANVNLVRQLDYRHDHFLNLASQVKNYSAALSGPGQVTETYAYDDLQRLLSATRLGSALSQADAYSYDDLGNLKSKSDYATSYSYGSSARTTANAGPHAVTQVTRAVSAGSGTASFAYDPNGNMTSGDGRTISFDLMDRPVQVTTSANGTSTSFSYAPDGSRYRQVVSGPAEGKYGPRTVYSIDKEYELTVWAHGVVEERSYLGPSVVVYRQGAAREVRFLHKDRLGSLDAVTWDDALASEFLVDGHGYDPWGKPRGREWTSSQERLHPAGEWPAQPPTTDRGFTGHEHLDVHHLIHMNGRVYDYRLGRFLSVDPFIGNPLNPQAVNPYSYIGNNPLSGTDPTGYISVSAGCGNFSRCDVIMVNPTRATASLYASSNASNGSVGQTSQVAKANAPDVHGPQQTAQQPKEGVFADDKETKDPVLLAQRGPRAGRGRGDLPSPRERRAEREDRLERDLESLQPQAGRRARIGPPGGVATEEQLRAREQLKEELAARQRAEAEARLLREPPQLARGKRAHREEPVLPGEQREVPTPSGRRMDRYNPETAHIREIKPDNPRQIRMGERQVQEYRHEMEAATGRPHTTEVSPYDPNQYR